MEDSNFAINMEEVVRTTTELTRENPRTALASAFVLGYLLGGGMTPRILLSIAALAVRRYAAEVAKEALGALAQRQFDEVAAH
jgi:hypothetical protein